MLGLPIAFSAPWLLLALAALPVLWLILRAIPPAPVRRRFPGVALLLGLVDKESTADRTPWWLLLLRALAVAAVIVGLAGPILDPRQGAGSGPLLIAVDDGWAAASDWSARQSRMEAALREAARDGRPAAILSLAEPPPGGPVFAPAEDVLSQLPGLQPKPWTPASEPVLPDGRFDTLWIADGLLRDGQENLAASFAEHGALAVAQGAPRLALGPPETTEEGIELDVFRPEAGTGREVSVLAVGPGPDGVTRTLASAPAALEDGATEATATLDLPLELRNRVERFALADVRSAGAVQVADDRLRRREVALLGAEGGAEALRLLDPGHYLREALEPNADILDGTLAEVLPANPDVIVIADGGQLPESDAIEEWVNEGGLLIRFAGPRLAASDVARGEEDPLLPVRLRQGGRTVGGAMSWGEPRSLRPFDPEGPFAGLTIPDEVRVSAQVMAEPGPDLAERTIAALDDGTPLVTRKELGQGAVVLFHVTANAEWSGLPLSGLFVDMLQRLALASGTGTPDAAEIEGGVWEPVVLLDAFGTPREADDMAAVPGEALAALTPSAATPPGLYSSNSRAVALNAVADAPEAARWPAGISPGPLAVGGERPLGGWFLTAALVLLALDAIASLAVGGRLRGPVAAALLAGLLLPAMPYPAAAQDVEVPTGAEPAPLGADEVRLAYVVTGDPQVDDLTLAGLRGLGMVLTFRTSIEPGDPVGVDPATDDLSLFPLLYWPVLANAPTPDADARARLNAFIQNGGMIVFDTRDADYPSSSSPERAALRRIASGLDIPPLERVPADHVLTRSFYLLQDFPGRFARPEVWVEASPADAEQAEGMPFRNLNDNVTPVLIGGGDWAAAWAEDETGRAVVPVGRGYAGERQREIARRFGVNLVMHVLSGNYKSDQVHVPALLERLGQ